MGSAIANAQNMIQWRTKNDPLYQARVDSELASADAARVKAEQAAQLADADLLRARMSGSPDRLPGYRKGTARVKGPGTRSSDSIPARLSKDEAVLNAGAADAMGRKRIANLNAKHARSFGMPKPRNKA